MNTMKKIMFVAVLGALLILTGCNAIENLSNSGTRLIISSIQGYDLSDEIGNTVWSDVLTSGSILNTDAIVNLRARLINPDAAVDDQSHYNDVIVDRIDVKFTRTDGRNQPLVDVPISFSVPTNQYVVANAASDTALTFTLIRHTAKEEPPLRDLREIGQEHILILTATITVYSHDLAGNQLEPATGWIEVHCADFADKKEEEEEPTT